MTLRTSAAAENELLTAEALRARRRRKGYGVLWGLRRWRREFGPGDFGGDGAFVVDVEAIGCDGWFGIEGNHRVAAWKHSFFRHL